MEIHANLPGRMDPDTAIQPLDRLPHSRENQFINLLVEKSRSLPTEDTQKFVKTGLESVERSMLAQVEIYQPDLKSAAKVVLSSAGKRLRPRIILLIGKLLGANIETLVTLASSIEMLHCATLVHDDLVDGSLLRRGISTLNANWSPAATILTGDFLFAAASDMAAKTNSIEVMRLFSRTLMTIVNGEINQLFVNRSSLDVETYYHRIYAKTASLFETSAQAAAMICTKDTQQIDLFRKFGYEMGMAFQIVDDILDYTGDESKVGKPIGGDLRQGIITLPMIHYLKDNPDDPAILNLTTGVKIRSENEIQRLIQAVSSSSAMETAYNDATLFVDRATACLQSFPDSSEKGELLNLAQFACKREK